MKIAVISESPVDEAAIKVLIDAILESESDLHSIRTRPHGWKRVFELLPNIIKGLHYNTDVEAFVVVVDSDESPLHQRSHEDQQGNYLECRLCWLRHTVRSALDSVRAVPNRDALKSATGLAVPAVEAWYRCGMDPNVSEATWNRRLMGERITYDKQSLKVSVYGSNQPGLARATDAAVSSARRLANNLELLERLFPVGFGCLMLDVRSWIE